MKFGTNVLPIISRIIHPALILNAMPNVKTDRSHFTPQICSWISLCAL